MRFLLKTIIEGRFAEIDRWGGLLLYDILCHMVLLN